VVAVLRRILPNRSGQMALLTQPPSVLEQFEGRRVPGGREPQATALAQPGQAPVVRAAPRSPVRPTIHGAFDYVSHSREFAPDDVTRWVQPSFFIEPTDGPGPPWVYSCAVASSREQVIRETRTAGRAPRSPAEWCSKHRPGRETNRRPGAGRRSASREEAARIPIRALMFEWARPRVIDRRLRCASG
jgi:hypothetical protein